MTAESLIHGLVLSGPHKGQILEWNDVLKNRIPEGNVWLHFDYTQSETIAWLDQFPDIDDLAVASILSEETRPRTVEYGDQLMLTLRGINTNPNADPEDMVSIRIWVGGRYIISARKRKLLSAQELADAIKQNAGPETAGEFLAQLSAKLIDRMQQVVSDMEDKVEEIEESVMSDNAQDLRGKIADLRRQSIALRRYLKPQREALEALLSLKTEILSQNDRDSVKETLNHLTRYLEELDALRERAAVTQEELAGIVAEQLNNRMYVLSVIAALFLPMGFLTGLLGINVGGIPGAEDASSFFWFCFILVVLASIQIFVFRRKRWF